MTQIHLYLNETFSYMYIFKGDKDNIYIICDWRWIESYAHITFWSVSCNKIAAR